MKKSILSTAPSIKSIALAVGLAAFISPLAVQAATTVIYSDNFNSNTPGTDLDGQQVQYSSVGSPTWTSADLLFGGTNTAAQNAGNGYIAQNAGHYSSLASLPTALGNGVYDIQANLFPEYNTVNPTGFLNIGFYHVNSGQWLWEPGTQDLALNIDALGNWWLQGSTGGLTVNSGTVVSSTSPVSTSGWSNTTAPLADLSWDTTNNTASASLNGVALFTNVSLNLLINASEVNYVGFGRDQQLGANSLVDNFQFSSITAIPVPGAIWLFGSALACFIGFNRRKPMYQPG